MSAPTEAEIREALEARMAEYPSDGGERSLRHAISEIFDLTLGEDDADAFDSAAIGDDFFCDLRPSEAGRLAEITADATARAFLEARALVMEAVVAAAIAFGTEYPDAPRRSEHPREAVA
jgi:hypothetical protein